MSAMADMSRAIRPQSRTRTAHRGKGGAMIGWTDQDALERRDLLGEYDPGTDPVPEDDDGEEDEQK